MPGENPVKSENPKISNKNLPEKIRNSKESKKNQMVVSTC
jgi:hypothetical protein